MYFEKSRVNEEQMQLTECKANHFKSEMDRLRERQLKIEHEKLELQKKIRDADYFVHQLTVEKDKREAEADKLKKELICAKLAEREATARLLNFLNRGRKNSDETTLSIMASTPMVNATNSNVYNNGNGVIHHQHHSQHPHSAMPPLSQIHHNANVGEGGGLLVASVSTPSLTNSNSTADINETSISLTANRNSHNRNLSDLNRINALNVVSVIGNQDEDEDVDDEVGEDEDELVVGSRAEVHQVDVGDEPYNEDDDFETKEFVLTESEMEQITKEIERSRLEYLSRKKQVQRQLQTLRSEIELLKIEENQTNLDILSEAQLKAGETKYSTLKKLKSGSTKARVAFFEEL